jgi:hypothetical protein
MLIIEIKHTREIPCNEWHGYVCEPSPEAAAAQYRKRYGSDPATVYYKVMPSGKCTVYIPIGECEGR